MTFRCFPETDMLYVELINGVSMESEEVAPGIVLDCAENKRVVGIEIEDASQSIDLSKLAVSALPLANLVFN
ncbi:MAG TPA: DUF2283 domain-containing protein, partial [Methylomirabilota bacterium]|nr:DUF2283 domain-containing protein [Methylomirabilota bacterium]